MSGEVGLESATRHLTRNIVRTQQMSASRHVSRVIIIQNVLNEYLKVSDRWGQAAAAKPGDNHGETDKWCSNRVQMKSRHSHHCTAAENV